MTAAAARHLLRSRGRRENRVSTGTGPWPAPAQTARFSRPLRRRAARTARPARVRIRSRKPWTLARRRLFGWNVRLLTGAPDTVRDKDRSGRIGPGTTRARPGGSTRGAAAAVTWLSLLTVKAIGAQVKPSRPAVPARGGPIPTAASPVRFAGRGTRRFPQRARLRGLRLWKINVRRPDRGRQPAPRARGTAVSSVHSLWTGLWTTSCGP